MRDFLLNRSAVLRLIWRDRSKVTNTWDWQMVHSCEVEPTY